MIENYQKKKQKIMQKKGYLFHEFSCKTGDKIKELFENKIFHEILKNEKKEEKEKEEKENVEKEDNSKDNEENQNDVKKCSLDEHKEI